MCLYLKWKILYNAFYRAQYLHLTRVKKKYFKYNTIFRKIYRISIFNIFISIISIFNIFIISNRKLNFFYKHFALTIFNLLTGFQWFYFHNKKTIMFLAIFNSLKLYFQRYWYNHLYLNLTFFIYTFYLHFLIIFPI